MCAHHIAKKTNTLSKTHSPGSSGTVVARVLQRFDHQAINDRRHTGSLALAAADLAQPSDCTAGGGKGNSLCSSRSLSRRSGSTCLTESAEDWGSRDTGAGSWIVGTPRKFSGCWSRQPKQQKLNPKLQSYRLDSYCTSGEPVSGCKGNAPILPASASRLS